ncbi:MAG: hypothetical protein ACYCZO_13355, partial [Daejeonella sp.]
MEKLCMLLRCRIPGTPLKVLMVVNGVFVLSLTTLFQVHAAGHQPLSSSATVVKNRMAFETPVPPQ